MDVKINFMEILGKFYKFLSYSAIILKYADDHVFNSLSHFQGEIF